MKSESVVQQEIMMEAPKYGVILMRNNSGAGKFINEDNGQESFVRFGLNNLSKEQNKRIKSSDLIGWVSAEFSFHPVTRIFQGLKFWVLGYNNDLANSVALFVAIEVKKEGWVYKGDEREVAQLAFINWVKSRGGIAGFASSVDDFLRIIGKL